MNKIKVYILSALTGLLALPALAQTDDCVKGDGVAQSIVYKVNGTTVSQLAGNVKSGSKVQVSFTVAGSTSTRFSLVSYTAPAAAFSYGKASEDRVYKSDSRVLNAGGSYTLTVTVPDCYFQVDFVKGCVIEKFGPSTTNNYYGRQGRLIASANGGSHYCSAKDKDLAYADDGSISGTTETNSGPCSCDNDGDGQPDAQYGTVNYNTNKTIKAQFSADGKKVIVTSTDKEISNIVVKYDGAPDYKYDNLKGMSYTITSDQYVILGVWVKAGDNASGDGPGYGEYIENLNSGENTGQCSCSADSSGGSGGGTGGTGGDNGHPKKVTICHIPPGNPSNAHTITISERAVDAHIKHHGDYYGECKQDTTTPPPPSDTCMCDYDLDGKNDKIYGSTFTSIDGSYAAKFNGAGDSVLVMSQTETITTITFYFEDGSTTMITDANTQSKWYSYPGQVIMAVELNGNIIENMSALDPDVMCDCTDIPGEPVPVKMTHFEGKKIAPNEVYLEWETASEQNSEYIAIEKSVDINTWREVCRVPTHGTTNDPHKYNCTDNNAAQDGQNLVYYRPKEVDLNGAYEYFDMIRIRLQDAAYASKVDNVYPNPTTGQLYVTYNASENGIFHIRLLSIDGKELLASSFVAKTGEQTTDLNLAEKQLKSGLYILEVQSENEVFRQKVYKQ
jgi:hypothetical protein